MAVEGMKALWRGGKDAINKVLVFYGLLRKCCIGKPRGRRRPDQRFILLLLFAQKACRVHRSFFCLVLLEILINLTGTTYRKAKGFSRPKQRVFNDLYDISSQNRVTGCCCPVEFGAQIFLKKQKDMRQDAACVKGENPALSAFPFCALFGFFRYTH